MGNQDGGVVLCSTNPPMEMESYESSSSKGCDECKTNDFKYKCPGCSIRSCSLPCVKAHKQRTGCTGKRQQQTEFVPLSKFDDNLLLSDYSMLEDVKRIADSAKRMRMQICGKYYSGLSFPLKHLLKAAKNRRIRLFFLPTGMSKREANKTYYNNMKKSIFWTIELHFHSTNVKLIDHDVHEDSNLYSVIENHLKPGPINHPLKPFCVEPLESLRIFISKHPKQPRSPFRELDKNAPISEQLANLVIVEYPVIHVLLPSHIPDFKVVKDFVPQRVQPKSDPVNESQPGPKGVFFKEEEIKDVDSSDPHVVDLMNQSNSKTATLVDDVKNDDKDKDKDNKVGAVDLMSFDFDPELMDVYSHLISETNPDDFLDLDGLLYNEMQLQDKDKEGKFGGVKEELEEGEIPDSD
ncbi:uncharacterized protein LOC111886804 [Lactuca sativa]|uniref:Box C/D snoRNA protein 1 n=1 Tax=Lactuca sativa TaxID=4236 RepID=A0A9R1VWI6_LACSA|nr:uncharacterized protein LOC111886804 [Lactuca sativa]KAJ0211946.1 hypothetical protein LSAT_V11C400175300 [Lactuca sativa]